MAEQTRTHDSQRRRRGPGGPGGPGGGPGGIGQAGEKAKNFKASMVRLAGFLSPHYLAIIVVVAFAVASTILSIYGPKKMAGATRYIIVGFVQKTAWQLGDKTLEEPMQDGGETLVDLITLKDIDLGGGRVLTGADFKAAFDKTAKIRDILRAAKEEDPETDATVGNAFTVVMQRVTSDALKTLMMSGKITQTDIPAIQAALQSEGGGASADGITSGMAASYAQEIKTVDLLDSEPKINFSGIANVLLFLAALYCFSALCMYFQGYIMAGVTQKTTYKMRSNVNAKLSRLPISYFDQNTHGEILSRVANDIDNIANTMNQSFTQIITSVTSLVGVAVMMLTINWILTVATVLTLPVSGLVTVLIAKRSQKQFAANQRELGELNGHIEEMFSGQRVVKAYAYEKKAIARFDDINERLYAAGWKSQFMSGIIMPALV
ncbi:MAG: ABC transporter ATP-binding protein, partial [Oscillospiraceae bacterium]|nr:ABC transporter ATP-binding protein [Oscillospiraceae bacterium]